MKRCDRDKAQHHSSANPQSNLEIRFVFAEKL